jgi:hypothetical protein
MSVTKAEFRWRVWVLGEGEFAAKGPRSKPRPDFGFGGKGQKPVPKPWFKRLGEFVAKREKDFEPKPEAPPKDDPLKRPGMISEHFNVREFDCHDGRRVPKAAEPALVRLAVQFLEPMRKKFGPARVLSGYRHKAYNRSIGGALFSQHDYDDDPTTVAADLTFAKGSPAQWAAEARRLSDRLGFGGVGEYRNSGFVHMDNRRYKARWSG